MAMKIDDKSHVQSLLSNQGQKVKADHKQAGAQTPGPAAPGDTVTITKTAASLKALAESLSNAPAVDSQRVEQIKAAIEDGSFEINSTRIAHMLMRFERDL